MRAIAILPARSVIVNNTVSTVNYDSVNYDIIQVIVRDVNIRVSKQLWVEPRSVTTITVVATASGLLRFEPNIALVQRRLLPANKSTEIMLNIPFQIVLINFSIHRLDVSKCVTVVRV